MSAKAILISIAIAVALPLNSSYAYDNKSFQQSDKATKEEFYIKYRTELFNKYDKALSDTERLRHSRKIYVIAKDNKDYTSQIEAIGDMCTNDRYHEDKYLKMAKSLPQSHAKKELITYLNFLKSSAMADATYGSNGESEFWNNLITEYKNSRNSDIYERIGALFNICVFYTKTLSGNLNQKYLDELGILINKLPKDGSNFLPQTYYLLTANYYVKQAGIQGQKEGIKSCRQAINNIDLNELMLKQSGRIYTNLDKNRYVIYSLMLKCNQVLSREELSECAKKIETMAAANKEINADFNSPYSLAKIRYYMSIKDYSSALPFLDNILNSKDLQGEMWLQKECMEYRFAAGKALGQEKEMRPYLVKYIRQREQENSDNLDEKIKELQMLYDVNMLKHKENRKQISILSISTLCIIALLFLTIVLLIRSKRTESRLKKSEETLVNEKDAIKRVNAKLEDELKMAESDNKMKTLFIQKMNQEIRKPLVNITNYSKLTADLNGKLTQEDKKNYALTIESNAKDLITMVETVLKVTENES